ncbi:efflux RND transporter periplasmic adaptor subunit [Belliella kenyensis]|uniref:Efflux RND transporter periplasmic adaptor subunit n=1 Tax=Belliella kenyensis TaxID=1472724 RepID=A0ABV8EJH4_9BACT|nr:efflux RND transporter periplasmic adaptor subunit [Belliella kenyensis]MCH7400969.1 efflux RND transporter periplasmic adaptor subunit [Belliella kenyensis]MDN3603967.1 efflux RND transporter periplasmic adaptor subunit [Belliella kenyensis]
MAKKQSNKVLYILLITVGVLVVFAFIGRSAGWIGGEKEIPVETTLAKKVTITEKVSASGVIEPEIEVKLSPDVAGEIIELNVVEGDSVKVGDLLVKIRPDNFISALDRAKANLNQQKANLAQAEANLKRAEAQYTRAELDYNRNEKLHKDKVISDSDWELAQSNFLTAKNDLDAAKQTVLGAEYIIKSSQATVNEANENLRLTNVYSPVNGTVSKLLVEKGERVVGTQQMAGTEMLRLADLSKMEVRVNVNENDIIRISLGDTTLIDVDSYASVSKKFKGVVTSIANSANTKASIDAVTEFEVKIRILNDSYAELVTEKNRFPFRPGMTASVDIITQKKENILAVPLAAVTTREDEVNTTADGSKKSKELVFVVKDGKASKREIKSGISDFDHIEVTEGVEEGDEIISGPYFTVSKQIKEGDLLKVTKKTE